MSTVSQKKFTLSVRLFRIYDSCLRSERLNDEPIKGKFYESELSLVRNADDHKKEFVVDKVLKDQSTDILSVGWDTARNTTPGLKKMHYEAPFYITLPSDVQLDTFSNTASDWTTKLKHAITLKGRWEVAIVELQYVNSIYTRDARSNY